MAWVLESGLFFELRCHHGGGRKTTTQVMAALKTPVAVFTKRQWLFLQKGARNAPFCLTVARYVLRPPPWMAMSAMLRFLEAVAATEDDPAIRISRET